MLRRLHHEQPESFAFTPANQAWAEGQITKYPEGRQASAVIPLLWRAQEQEGWLSRPAIEHVADMLGMAHIRVLEVATFYFMFQLQPVGAVAHIQICGTTSCMICGAEDLIGVCREKIAPNPHQISEDGKLSWEEVECLGSCTNAPMAQIGKDYYEDLTAERFGEILEALRAGDVPVPGPQNGRYASEPKSGLTSLTGYAESPAPYNASVHLATDIGDTVKRIDGTEVPLLTPWRQDRPAANSAQAPAEAGEADAAGDAKADAAKADAGQDATGAGTVQGDTGAAASAEPQALLKPSKPLAGQAELAARKGQWRYEGGDARPAAAKATPAPTPSADPATDAPATEGEGTRPAGLEAARGGQADDLKMIKGIGPKLEQLCNSLGFFHFDQVAAWTGAEVAWVDQNLKGFKGRVTRDNWVEQARLLADGVETEFAKRAKDDGLYET